MDTRHTTKDGSLTAYSLACGYVQAHNSKEFQMNLSQVGTGWCLRLWNCNNSFSIVRETFYKLTDAKKRFNKLVKIIEYVHFFGIEDYNKAFTKDN